MKTFNHKKRISILSLFIIFFCFNSINIQLFAYNNDPQTYTLAPIPEINELEIEFGESVPLLYAEGQNIKWYTDAELTDLVHEGENFTTNPNEIGKYTYYVSQTIDNESLAYTITITILPLPPIAVDVIAYENQDTILLTADGINIRWFSDEAIPLYDERDGQVYKTVVIGEQVWMAENLIATKYNDGTPIHLVTDNSEWAALNEGAYCWYDTTGSGYKQYNKEKFGALYNWYTVETEKLCPVNWYVPSGSDWKELNSFLGDIYYDMYAMIGINAGAKLKSTGSIELGDGLWYEPNIGSTNESGFTALPGGYRDYYSGQFHSIGTSSYYWHSSSFFSEYNAGGYTYMSYVRLNSYSEFHNKREGYSVRCMRTKTEPIIEDNDFIINHRNPGIQTYCVTQTINGIESHPKTVILTIQSKSSIPEAESVTITEGETIPDLTAIGQNIKWYSDAELMDLVYEGESFPTNHTNVGQYTYYVTQTIDYESMANEVTLTIQPAQPIAGDVDACENQDNILLYADGENIKWYLNEEMPLYDERDGRVYQTVGIGDQVWMAENLDYYTSNGSLYYNDDSITYSNDYGRLYNWETAMNSCPVGWHLPSHVELETLNVYLGSTNTGGKLKEEGLLHWESPNFGATNETGFSGIGGGIKNRDYEYTDINIYGHFWSSTTYFSRGQPEGNWAYISTLHNNSASLVNGTEYKDAYISVRCLRDVKLGRPISYGSTLAVKKTIGIYYYYVTQTINGVESEPDTVMLIVHPIAPKPITENVTATTVGAIPDLTTTGQNIKWYSDEELTNLVFEGESFETGNTTPGIYTYYVTQTIGCESMAETITLTILPAPPIAEDVTACTGQENVSLYAEGENIKWYSDQIQQLNDERDGQVYETVIIGEQVWMSENLDYDIENGSWYYNNDNLFSGNYGRLYNWETALNACPSGWRLPSDEDWKKLEINLGMSESEADKMGYISRGS